MHSEPAVVGADHIHTSGVPSLTQGAYGARGNLELVACDAADGLWVFWFNADLDTDPLETPDVPPGSWSAGLRFAAGRRYVEAQILQSTLGPDHLEVLALAAGGILESWYWSPGPGFQRRVTDAATGVAAFAADHDRGTVRVAIRDVEGAMRGLVSPPRGYPSRVWLPAEGGPSLGIDAADAVTAAGVPAETVEPGTARSTVSTRSGGMTELTWRGADGSIRHLGVPFA
ncbi:hypothetical protein ABZ477_15130 [Microbacterium sp. NPDC019599]|uniref:hypothetical protein n=1 Tax=Microbacterium sp. NPDC019599 TaxID=3154690 RepID=UPI0033CD1C0A